MNWTHWPCFIGESGFFLQEHTRSDHRKPYQCIKCQQFFGTEKEIQLHVATHVMQDGVVHNCALCLQSFDSPSKLQCHLIEHSFVGCQEFRCYLCNMTFSLSQPLMQHMLNSHFDERPYDCVVPKCQQKFFFRAELDNHTLSAHPSLYNADSDEFKPPSSMNKQFCTETKAEDAQCNSIGQNSSSLASGGYSPVEIGPQPLSLQSSASMSSFASFPCPHCPKSFSSLSALQGHSHVHMSNRIHRCSKCAKVIIICILHTY